MNEAELLFSETLNCSRTDLYLNKALRLNSAQVSFIAGALKRRLSGEPLEYILGKTEFMGLEFKLDENVFIPRPETELLVEKVLALLENREQRTENRDILELGTGSGCIAVSVAKYLDNVRITATDISEKALQVARINARINRVEDKIVFLRSNLFEAISDKRYALCVCNPPYIPSAEIDNLQPEVRHEPRLALDGGEDGLDFYRRMIKEAGQYLEKDSYLIMEMGFGQKDAIKDIVGASGIFKTNKIIKDYSGIDRIILVSREERDG